MNAVDSIKMDRTKLTISPINDIFFDKYYWLSKTPQERLEALEINRQIAYGYDPDSTRLQRVLEVAERT
ncbi:hypothetical protein JXI42_03310 [bacterium]|nr:hypothetical protein [bacterium]